MPSKTLAEKTWFKADGAETDEEKNTVLARHLGTIWPELSIVRIERIEIGSEKGWRATYRE